MSNAVLYHAGGPVSVAAEQQFAAALGLTRHRVDVVHLGERTNRIAEAESAGVKSVPSLVIGGTPFYIIDGAALADLR